MEQGFVKQRMAMESLDERQTKIIGVRPTKDENQVQLVYLQNTGEVNLDALHHIGDDRWSTSSGRPAWIGATIKSLEVLYSDYPEVLIAANKCVEEQDYVSLDINNPKIKGRRVIVTFNETLTPRASDIANNERLQQNAKQDGNGNFLLKDGYAIFERVTLGFDKGQEIHNRIEHNSSTTDFQDLMYQEPRTTSTDPDKEPAPKGDKDLTGQEA